MATGQEVLDFYKVTISQALQFIEANINKPQTIFNKANESGITIQHLSDITGYSTDIISNYFVSAGLNPRKLDEVKLIFNSSVGDLESIVSFNSHSGALSNIELGDRVETVVDPIKYQYFFEPFSQHEYEQIDGVLTPDESGISHLGNVPATSDSMESIVYGSLINLYSQLDETELRELKEFPYDENNKDQYRSILIESLKDSANYTDNVLADLVVSETASIIEEFWNHDIVGVLDHSILGLAGEI